MFWECNEKAANSQPQSRKYELLSEHIPHEVFMLCRNGISVYLAIVLVEECISEMVHGYGFYFLGQNNPYSQGRSGDFDGLNIFI